MCPMCIYLISISHSFEPPEWKVYIVKLLIKIAGHEPHRVCVELEQAKGVESNRLPNKCHPPTTIPN